MPVKGQMVVVRFMMLLKQLLPQLILLLLLVERLDNTLLLLFDRVSSRSVVDFPPRILIVLILARITGSVFMLRVIKPHPFPPLHHMLLLMLLLVYPILVSLLAERFNYTLFLLLDGRLDFHDLLVIDHHINRVVRITARVILDQLLRMVVMRAVI